MEDQPRFTQHVEHCPEHPGCTVISCVSEQVVAHPETGAVLYPAGTVVWSSHLDEAVHAAHRVNRGYPAVDHRYDGVAVSYEPPCPACAERLPAA